MGADQCVRIKVVTIVVAISLVFAVQNPAFDNCPRNCSGRGLCFSRWTVPPGQSGWDWTQNPVCECLHGYFGHDCAQGPTLTALQHQANTAPSSWALITKLAWTDTNYQDSLDAFAIVPDLLDKSPIESNVQLHIAFDDLIVEMGTRVSVATTAQPPTVKWNGSSNLFYSLFLLDADAPTVFQPALRNFAHWIVTNVPGNRIEDGEERFSWRSVHPTEPFWHRYSFLLFEHSGKIDFGNDIPFIDATDKFDRELFDIRHLMKIYPDLGEPLSIKMFTSRNETIPFPIQA